MTLHFSNKQKKFYHVGNVECSFCGLLITNGGLLRELFNRRQQSLKQIICIPCISKNKLKNAHADVIRHTFFVCVASSDLLPVDCFPVFLHPPEFSNGNITNTFQAVSSAFDQQFDGTKSIPVQIIDNTKWSFKNQSEQIDVKEKEKKLLSRLNELDMEG